MPIPAEAEGTVIFAWRPIEPLSLLDSRIDGAARWRVQDGSRVRAGHQPLDALPLCEREKEVTPLRIGKSGFSLPIELVTSTQAILGLKAKWKPLAVWTWQKKPATAMQNQGGFAAPVARLTELGFAKLLATV